MSTSGVFQKKWLLNAALILALALPLLAAPAPAQAGLAAAQLDVTCVAGVLQIEWDAFFSPPPPSTNVVTVNGEIVATGVSGTTSVPGTGLMIVEVREVFGEDFFMRAQEIVTCAPAVQPDSDGGCHFDDGRVNATECAPPVVPYCLPYGIFVYEIDPQTGEGSLLMMVRDEVIAAIGIPDENTTLAQANGVIFSRLTTGEFQINAPDFEGKPYTLVWDDCPPGEVYLIKGTPKASSR
ncbi:MAG: hypothetical protein JXN59_17250 [Anaerolineae bacterium]|nr:hypothetical protein [Anaerolineae bacterium]